MDYTIMIDQERAKLDLLRATYAQLATQIADSEQFISVLEKRAGQVGDALGKFLEGQLATKSPLTQISTAVAGLPAEEAGSYEFPKIRSDSIWPHVVRLMAAKPVWRVDEIIGLALERKLVKTDSAIRSTMSALKKWNFVENDTPGLFSLKPMGQAFVKTLKPDQFILEAIAETTHNESNV